MRVRVYYKGVIIKDDAGKGTRKGTKANHPLGRLVNVTNGLEIRRIKFTQAYLLVDSNTGWKFCPKKFKLEVSNETVS